MNTSLFYRTWYSFWFYIVALVMVLTCRMRVRGAGNLPRDGPAIVLANHTAFSDPGLMGLALFRRPAYLARDTLFKNRVLGWIFRSFGGVPIDRNFGKEGLRLVSKVLAATRVLVVFPAGTRVPDGTLGEFKKGFLLLLRRGPKNTKVVLAGIAGAFDSWPKGRLLPRPVPTAVSLGQAMPSEYFTKMDPDEAVRQIQAGLLKQIALAEHLRGKRPKEPQQ